MQKIFYLIFLALFMTVAIQGTVYKEPTAQFKPKIEVSALFIEHKNRILLLHR